MAYSHSQSPSPSASGHATVTNVRLSGKPSKAEERVSLAGVKPEDALRALLATHPAEKDDQ